MSSTEATSSVDSTSSVAIVPTSSSTDSVGAEPPVATGAQPPVNPIQEMCVVVGNISSLDLPVSDTEVEKRTSLESEKRTSTEKTSTERKSTESDKGTGIESVTEEDNTDPKKDPKIQQLKELSDTAIAELTSDTTTTDLFGSTKFPFTYDDHAFDLTKLTTKEHFRGGAPQEHMEIKLLDDGIFLIQYTGVTIRYKYFFPYLFQPVMNQNVIILSEPYNLRELKFTGADALSNAHKIFDILNHKYQHSNFKQTQFEKKIKNLVASKIYDGKVDIEKLLSIDFYNCDSLSGIVIYIQIGVYKKTIYFNLRFDSTKPYYCELNDAGDDAYNKNATETANYSYGTTALDITIVGKQWLYDNAYFNKIAGHLVKIITEMIDKGQGITVKKKYVNFDETFTIIYNKITSVVTALDAIKTPLSVADVAHKNQRRDTLFARFTEFKTQKEKMEKLLTEFNKYDGYVQEIVKQLTELESMMTTPGYEHTEVDVANFGTLAAEYDKLRTLQGPRAIRTVDTELDTAQKAYDDKKTELEAEQANLQDKETKRKEFTEEKEKAVEEKQRIDDQITEINKKIVFDQTNITAYEGLLTKTVSKGPINAKIKELTEQKYQKETTVAELETKSNQLQRASDKYNTLLTRAPLREDEDIAPIRTQIATKKRELEPLNVELNRKKAAKEAEDVKTTDSGIQTQKNIIKNIELSIVNHFREYLTGDEINKAEFDTRYGFLQTIKSSEYNQSIKSIVQLNKQLTTRTLVGGGSHKNNSTRRKIVKLTKRRYNIKRYTKKNKGGAVLLTNTDKGMVDFMKFNTPVTRPHLGSSIYSIPTIDIITNIKANDPKLAKLLIRYSLLHAIIGDGTAPRRTTRGNIMDGFDPTLAFGTDVEYNDDFNTIVNTILSKGIAQADIAGDINFVQEDINKLKETMTTLQTQTDTQVKLDQYVKNNSIEKIKKIKDYINKTSKYKNLLSIFDSIYENLSSLDLDNITKPQVNPGETYNQEDNITVSNAEPVKTFEDEHKEEIDVEKLENTLQEMLPFIEIKYSGIFSKGAYDGYINERTLYNRLIKYTCIYTKIVNKISKAQEYINTICTARTEKYFNTPHTDDELLSSLKYKTTQVINTQTHGYNQSISSWYLNNDTEEPTYKFILGYLDKTDKFIPLPNKDLTELIIQHQKQNLSPIGVFLIDKSPDLVMIPGTRQDTTTTYTETGLILNIVADPTNNTYQFLRSMFTSSDIGFKDREEMILRINHIIFNNETTITDVQKHISHVYTIILSKLWFTNYSYYQKLVIKALIATLLFKKYDHVKLHFLDQKGGEGEGEEKLQSVNVKIISRDLANKITVKDIESSEGGTNYVIKKNKTKRPRKKNKSRRLKKNKRKNTKNKKKKRKTKRIKNKKE
jgi:hypothetical protein